ncbi:hypothetical protein BRI6_3769 [plant metagenome]|uniref:Uncharacterized protein n=1 Tax=plant metagenome TaxID=1297885 RepID=A0A484UT99_9ZZZZ
MNANPRQAPLPPRRACRTARGRAVGLGSGWGVHGQARKACQKER